MSLKVLAKQLDLSVSTVSRALNGYADINETTRQRTLHAAKALGYRPNSLAKRLAEGRTGTVAVILTPPQGEFAPPMYLGFLQGIDDALQAQGMDTLVTMSQAPPDELRVFRRLVEGKRVDGMIFGRTRPKDQRIRYLQDNDVPFVVIGQCPGVAAFPFVDVDRKRAAYEAVGLLHELGHYRIALLNTAEQFVFSQMARAGFLAGIKAAGLAGEFPHVVDAGFDETSGCSAATTALRRQSPPTAFVCGNDLLAIGCMRALRAAGLVPGRDRAVVSCEDNQPARLAEPPVTAFSAPTVDVGRKAVDLLMRRMAGEPQTDLKHIFGARLVERGTHCAAPVATGKLPPTRRRSSAATKRSSQ